MQLSWYIAAFYSIQREYVTLVKLCIHGSVFGWLCPSPRRNSAAGLREGEREMVSKKCNLGSKYRKKEKKHHERIAGKRVWYRSSTMSWLPQHCRHCWVLAGHPVCLAWGARQGLPGVRGAVDQQDTAPQAEIFSLYTAAARHVWDPGRAPSTALPLVCSISCGLCWRLRKSYLQSLG